MALKRDDLLHDLRRRVQEPDAPSGHRKALGGSVHEHERSKRIFREFQNARRHRSVGAIIDTAIDFVRDQPNASALRPTRDRLEIFGGIDRSRRVSGRAKDEPPCSVGRGRLEVRRGQAEIILFGSAYEHRLGPGQVDHLRIAGPIWCGNKNVVTWAEKHERGVEHCLLRPRRNHDISGVDMTVRDGADMTCDGGPQFRRAGGWRVPCLARSNSLDRLIGDERRRIEVRLPRAQVDDVAPLGAQPLGQRTHGKGRGGLKPSDIGAERHMLRARAARI